MEKMRMESKDIRGTNIEKIGELFPSVITEVEDSDTKKIKKAIDFDALRTLLADDLPAGGGGNLIFSLGREKRGGYLKQKPQ